MLLMTIQMKEIVWSGSNKASHDHSLEKNMVEWFL
jgi:hypothetical protein